MEKSSSGKVEAALKNAKTGLRLGEIRKITGLEIGQTSSAIYTLAGKGIVLHRKLSKILSEYWHVDNAPADAERFYLRDARKLKRAEEPEPSGPKIFDCQELLAAIHPGAETAAARLSELPSRVTSRAR